MTIIAGFISRKKEFQEAADEQIQKALEMCGLLAEGYAKKKCPVDTGNLRNSISHKVVPEDKAVYIGTNVEYAPYVELGTGSFYKGGTPGIKGQRAQPYLKPAVANHRNEYKQIIIDELKG